jgi:hypothetical protein
MKQVSDSHRDSSPVLRTPPPTCITQDALRKGPPAAPQCGRFQRRINGSAAQRTTASPVFLPPQKEPLMLSQIHPFSILLCRVLPPLGSRLAHLRSRPKSGYLRPIQAADRPPPALGQRPPGPTGRKGGDGLLQEQFGDQLES